MKKTDVYVVVDTPKKAKKLKKVLDMFGEKHFADVHLLDFEDCVGRAIHFWENRYFARSGIKRIENDKSKVSIKELRNILAKDYLKEGDVVVAGINGSDYKWLVKFESFRNYGDFLGYYTDLKSSYELTYHTGLFDNFIRYATEEEKAFLEPKKELEVGKWYKSWNDTHNGYDLSYYTGTSCDYGFHSSDCWYSEQYWIKNTMPSEWKEAAPQEVEQALIGEAKRRGFVNGCVGNNSNIHDKKLKNCELFFFNNQYEFDEKDNLLRVILDFDTTWTVFKDGQWATVIEQDNFTDSDIAIIERLHDTLLDNHGYSLESKLLTDAIMLANKIKSNIK